MPYIIHHGCRLEQKPIVAKDVSILYTTAPPRELWPEQRMQTSVVFLRTAAAAAGRLTSSPSISEHTEHLRSDGRYSPALVLLPNGVTEASGRGNLNASLVIFHSSHGPLLALLPPITHRSLVVA